MADAKCYTWKQFNDAVTALVPVDAARIGSVPSLIALWTRACIIELQNYIEAYRWGHETVYHASDFVLEGAAARATLPPQANVQDAFLVVYNFKADGVTSDGTCQRYPLQGFEWADRMAMVHGRVAINGGMAYIAIDPRANTFYVYPGIKDCQDVSVFWDGLKVEFQDGDNTPFDEQMTQVVADYVKARLTREVDKDIPLYQSFMEDYSRGRTNLYLNCKSRTRTKQ